MKKVYGILMAGLLASALIPATANATPTASFAKLGTTGALTEGGTEYMTYMVNLSETIPASVEYSYTITTNNQCLGSTTGKGGMDTPVNPFTRTGYAVKGYTHLGTINLVVADDSTYESGHSCSFTYQAVSTAPEYPFSVKVSGTVGINDNDPAPKPVATAPTPVPAIKTPAPAPKTAVTAPAAPKAQAAVAATPAPIALETIKLNDAPYAADKKPVFDAGKGVTFSGKAMPNATVTLYVYSEPKKFTVKADAQGNWTHTVNGLESGDHHAEAEITDPATNKTSERKEIARFAVKAAAAAVISGSNTEKMELTSKKDKPVMLISGAAVLAAILAAGMLLVLKRRKRPTTFNQ